MLDDAEVRLHAVHLAHDRTQGLGHVMFCVWRGSRRGGVGPCVVTMQDGDDHEPCIAFLAECPPGGSCESDLDALTMANDVHKGDDKAPRPSERVYIA